MTGEGGPGGRARRHTGGPGPGDASGACPGDTGGPDREGDGARDSYAEWVRSEEYLRERREKADVVTHAFGHVLSRSRLVCDIGSGTGIIARVLAERFGCTVLPVEADRSRMVEPYGVVADALGLPFGDATFDAALLNHVYEHVSDQRGLFAEVRRVLRPGGTAYVAAGNRLAVMEPHYRLPFLSWLPRTLASAYVRLAGQAQSYDDIRFRTYGTLRAMMEEAGFVVHDVTEDVVGDLVGELWGRRWRTAWRAFLTLPRGMRRWLVPQWFFLLEPDSGRHAPGAAG